MKLNLSRYLSIKHWIIFISFRFRILVACILHTSTFNHRESRNQALASILRSSFLFIDVFKHQYSFHRTTIIIIHEDSKSLWLEELAMFGVFGMFLSLIEMYIAILYRKKHCNCMIGYTLYLRHTATHSKWETKVLGLTFKHASNSCGCVYSIPLNSFESILVV